MSRAIFCEAVIGLLPFPFRYSNESFKSTPMLLLVSVETSLEFLVKAFAAAMRLLFSSVILMRFSSKAT